MFDAHLNSYLCPLGFENSRTLINHKTTHQHDIILLCITLVSKYVNIQTRCSDEILNKVSNTDAG